MLGRKNCPEILHSAPATQATPRTLGRRSAVFPLLAIRPAPFLPPNFALRPDSTAQPICLCRAKLSFAPQFPQPLLDSLAPFPDPWCADSPVFFKNALFTHRAHANSFPILFKLQPVSRAHTQPPPDFPGNRHLSFARYLRPLFHSHSHFLTLTHISLLFRAGFSLPLLGRPYSFPSLPLCPLCLRGHLKSLSFHRARPLFVHEGACGSKRGTCPSIRMIPIR